ncbi:MAG: VOC family protein [Opitutaceae bacterium]|jgi:catechol 2,3-dioxygenase-like lactoylglutathione lyase family enzyme
MRFRSNHCIAIHLTSLAKAERFYSDILGFKLKSKTRSYLEYDTGHFLLYVNRSAKAQPPTPSFSVKSIARAKKLLKGARCKILVDRGSSLYFQDPFGNVFDIIED